MVFEAPVAKKVRVKKAAVSKAKKSPVQNNMKKINLLGQ